MTSTVFFSLIFPKKSFRKAIRVSNSLSPDQDRHLSVLILVQTVCKGYQTTAKVAAGMERVKPDSLHLLSRNRLY